MRPFAERRYLPREARAAFHLATFLVGGIQERQPEIRCHELAVAVRQLILEEIDGLIVGLYTGTYGAVEHSWLGVAPTGTWPRDQAILDVYAVGRLPQVQLVDGSAMMPEAKLYQRADQQRSDLDQVIVTLLIVEMRRLVEPSKGLVLPPWRTVNA